MIQEAAKQYLERGWIPVPLDGKNPHINGLEWQKRDYGIDAFSGRNIGVILGERSAGLVDVDLDCAESRRLAAFFLPDTQAIFGRGEIASHCLYVTAKRLSTTQYKDPINKDTIVEYRDGTLSTGFQTMFPPSKHPDTKETLAWIRVGEPAKVHADDLYERVKRIAAGSLLVRYWPEKGSRHEAHNALAGGLTRMGWREDAVQNFANAIRSATGDTEARDRKNCAKYTMGRIYAGKDATGWPTLAGLLKSNGAMLVATICECA